MALRDVNEKVNIKKLTELKVGESLVGYLMSIDDNPKYEGQKQLIMKVGGERCIVPTVGNVKYAAADGKLSVGLKTVFTRLEDRKIKGKTATQFRIQQDDEDVLQSSGSPSIAGTPASSIADKIKSLKG